MNGVTGRVPAATVLPGLTLLLARPAPGDAGAAFAERLEERVGRNAGAVLLDLDTLERAGLTRTGPLGRASFEHWLSIRAHEAIRASTSGEGGWARFPVFVVGSLNEPLARKHGLGLPERLRAAIARIPLPRGVEPLPIGIWLVPGRWTPLEGAELFAWLKEFAATLAKLDEDAAHERGYALNLLLGRSDVDAPASTGALSRPDHDLAARAAEFVAACHRCRTLDWVLAAGRGRHRHDRFHALGIAAIATDEGRDETSALADAKARSRILWPTSTPTTPSDEWIARAILGARAAPLDGWDRVAPLGRMSPPDRWLCRLAFGLDVRDVVGALDWRAHYRRLPEALRRELHAEPDAAHLPDPLERPEAPEPTERAPEPEHPILPVL